MADVYAVKNGNWSDTTLWNTGALPTTADDVYADGRVIYIDIDAQVLSISNGQRSGGTVNGYFIGNSGVSLSANILCRNGNGGGVTGCLELLSASPSTFTVYGNVFGSTSVNGRAVRCTSSGTLTVYGGVSGGTGSGTTWGIDNQLTGFVNVIGDVRAFNVTNAGAINNGSTGTISVTGNIFGSTTPGASNCRGIRNIDGTVNVLGDIWARATTDSGNNGILNSTGVNNPTVNVIGSIFGGGHTTLINSGTGTVNISGNVFGTAGVGVANTGSSGTINIRGNVTAVLGTGCSQSGNGTLNVVGNIQGGQSSAVAVNGISNTAAGIVNVVGNSTGGSNTNTHGIGMASTSTGTVNITGNCFGGTSGTVNGLSNGSTTATANIFGDVYAGSSAEGARMNGSTGTINIMGNSYGGRSSGAGSACVLGTINIMGSAVGGDGGASASIGVRNINGTVTVSGACIGGRGVAGSFGATNEAAGILRVKRAVGNDWGLGYTTTLASVPGVASTTLSAQTFVEELQLGPKGQWPTQGVIFFTPNSKATSIFKTDTFQNYSLIQSNSADNLVPPVSSVRQGEVYNLGSNTGTCIIPSVSSVATDTAVDNTFGTAVLTSQTTWNYPTTASDVNSMGGRLRNALNTNSANSLINSFNP